MAALKEEGMISKNTHKLYKRPFRNDRIHVARGEGVPPSLAEVSHAVAVGPLCHTGGQLAIDAEGRLLDGSVSEQADLAFRNLLSVLAAAGFSKNDIVFVDITLSDIGELPDVNAAFRRVFVHPPRPARAVMEASALPLGAKVRLHALAVRSDMQSAAEKPGQRRA